jgi:hypothetical protein
MLACSAGSSPGAPGRASSGPGPALGGRARAPGLRRHLGLLRLPLQRLQPGAGARRPVHRVVARATRTRAFKGRVIQLLADRHHALPEAFLYGAAYVVRDLAGARRLPERRVQRSSAGARSSWDVRAEDHDPVHPASAPVPLGGDAGRGSDRAAGLRGALTLERLLPLTPLARAPRGLRGLLDPEPPEHRAPPPAADVPGAVHPDRGRSGPGFARPCGCGRSSSPASSPGMPGVRSGSTPTTSPTSTSWRGAREGLPAPGRQLPRLGPGPARAQGLARREPAARARTRTCPTSAPASPGTTTCR